MSDILQLLITIIIIISKPIFYLFHLVHLDEAFNYLLQIALYYIMLIVSEYKIMYFVILFAIFFIHSFIFKKILIKRKKKTIYMKIKEKLIKFAQKCDFWFHSWFNNEAYQYHKETKLDREAFGIEEQIFHQSVPPRILNKPIERDFNESEELFYHKTKSYSDKYDKPFRERYT